MSSKENTVLIIITLAMVVVLAFWNSSLSLRITVLETAAHDHGWTLVKP